MPYITDWKVEKANNNLTCEECKNQDTFSFRIWQSKKDKQILNPPSVTNVEYRCEVCGITWTQDLSEERASEFN